VLSFEAKTFRRRLNPFLLFAENEVQRGKTFLFLLPRLPHSGLRRRLGAISRSELMGKTSPPAKKSN